MRIVASAHTVRVSHACSFPSPRKGMCFLDCSRCASVLLRTSIGGGFPAECSRNARRPCVHSRLSTFATFPTVNFSIATLRLLYRTILPRCSSGLSRAVPMRTVHAVGHTDLAGERSTLQYSTPFAESFVSLLGFSTGLPRLPRLGQGLLATSHRACKCRLICARHTHAHTPTAHARYARMRDRYSTVKEGRM